MQVKPTPLSQPQRDKLQSWLKQPPMGELIRVLESRVFECEANASKSAVERFEGGVDRPGMENQTKQHAEKAIYWRTMIDDLIELRDTTKPIETFTAIPTTK